MDTNTTILLVAVVGIGAYLVFGRQSGGNSPPVSSRDMGASDSGQRSAAEQTARDVSAWGDALLRLGERASEAYANVRTNIQNAQGASK